MGDLASPVLVATRNAGKARELRALLAPLGIDVVTPAALGLPPDPAEDDVERWPTFEENALAKARWFHQRVGLPALADDSGLEVLALGGVPGVRSRRYSGRDDLTGSALDAANNAKLVAALAGVADRRARFVCAAALVDGERELVRRGVTTGRIVDEGRGDEGFGYDAHFLSDEIGRTFGEASIDEKERISHRGRAVRALLEALRGEAGRVPVDPPGRSD